MPWSATGSGSIPKRWERPCWPARSNERMNAIGAATTDDYFGIVTANSGEQAALAAELVVPETWFFRGGRSLFDSLAGFISARAATRPTDTPVRTLSVPCSTGEEPYSLAIALQEQRVQPAAYRIDGVDLSVAHLTRANAAAIHRFLVSRHRPRHPTAHFQQTGDRWELHPAVRENRSVPGRQRHRYELPRRRAALRPDPLPQSVHLPDRRKHVARRWRTWTDSSRRMVGSS